ncbi:MAG: cupin-like domain-containing protein, partial [Phenylobacterium sp.]
MSQPIREIAASGLADRGQFLREVAEPCLPVVIRGLVSHWPAVRAAARSPQAFRDYLSPFAAPGQVEAFFGEPRIAGKYYYSDDLKGFNFERRRMGFSEAVDAMVAS